MCDWICDVAFYIQNILCIFWEWLDAEKFIAICAGAFTIKEGWSRYGHKFSVLTGNYFNVFPGYEGEIILYNLKNKMEVICKLYAKLRDNSFVLLDTDIERKLNAEKIDTQNPIIIEPYQNKKIYVRKASYYKQFTAEEGAEVFNYIDIHNKIICYYAILSDGEIIKINGLNPNKEIFGFENDNDIIVRQICCGKARIKNKILLEFKLYNSFGTIDVLCSDGRKFSTNLGEGCSEREIKREISQQAKLPKNCTIELDARIKKFLSTLKQKEFPKMGLFQRIKDKIRHCKYF